MTQLSFLGSCVISFVYANAVDSRASVVGFVDSEGVNQCAFFRGYFFEFGLVPVTTVHTRGRSPACSELTLDSKDGLDVFTVNIHYV